ncbi:N-acetylglucosamine-1-phosphotransferase subunits alpha/beta-like isoform X2 [Dunckerocampus dactyliophorus]|uniref:N-acetylglucosamine-1-phosphotransferase subunits alpha/beta-like isoform X2 n=1 Tax=Dunckerocampus dactyliophorus TaxID=161453 RepID=UPI0024071689|nr:N-acetylglucosamine-1-phosphotransferase subunits alpha/beta-like isoform X2 [Dunckerocampus dactyliophorus]
MADVNLVLRQLLRQTYTCRPHRRRALIYCGALLLFMVSIHQIGERVAKQSLDRSRHMVLDMLKNTEDCKSFHSRKCTPMPVDLVYTWVNGTDETLLRNLLVAKKQLADKERAMRKKPRCPLSNCISAPMLALDPAVPASFNASDLSSISPYFSSAKALLKLNKPLKTSDTVSVVIFHSQTDAEKALTKTPKENKTFSITKCYLTTDKDAPRVIQMQTVAYLSGFTGSFKTSEMLRAKLPSAITNKITAFELYKKARVALLHFGHSQDLTNLLQEAKQAKESTKKMTLNGKELVISPVYLFWDLSAIIKVVQMQPVPTEKATRDVLTANRFEDNDALRHSLRSVEKFAPWVRHIFVVTNGQIPFWLDLSNPRVSVVTHKEIFQNQSHLPTFSSGAIESHLHRIRGISQKFIYLNDDIMLGKDIWLDDFYTPSKGQKVYVTWPIRPCAQRCPGTLIKNQRSNPQCNNAACDWDGGNCKSRKQRSGRSVGRWWGSTTTGAEFPQASKSEAASQNQALSPKPPILFLNKNEDKIVPKVKVSGVAAAPLWRMLQQLVSSHKGFQPLEKIKYFQDLLEEDKHLRKALLFDTNGAVIGRKLQSTFSESLRFVNRLYNRKFGIMTRKAPAHTPHMFDKFIMQELQDTFPKEFEKTSSHYLRQSNDMQISFSYYYFLMSVKHKVNISEVFDMADKDHSGILSDSEIQDLSRRIQKQTIKPLDFEVLKKQLITCCKTLSSEVTGITQMKPSQPPITKDLVLNCKPVTDHICIASTNRKYKYQVMGQQDIHYKFLTNNASNASQQFKDVLTHPRKFICINDGLDHTESTSKEVKAKLAKFYQAMFPQPSTFELPKSKSNRILYRDELWEWQAYQEKLRFYSYCAIGALVILILKLLFGKTTHLKGRLLHRHKEAKV